MNFLWKEARWWVQDASSWGARSADENPHENSSVSGEELLQDKY